MWAFLKFIRAKFLCGREKKNWFFSPQSFSVICCSICPQNTSLISLNETMASNSMRLNPHIQFYSTIYVVTMGAALLLKTLRGLVFVKVSHHPPHHVSSEHPHPTPHTPHTHIDPFVSPRSVLLNTDELSSDSGVWKEYGKLSYYGFTVKHCSSLIVFIVIHSCSHGSSAVIENACGPNPFICPRPCLAALQLQNVCVMCLCASVSARETKRRREKKCVCVCLCATVHLQCVCVCVSVPLRGARPLFQSNPSWHRIAEVGSPR